MPKKYHIDTRETPRRMPMVGRSGIVDWGEGCLKCAVCVKQKCIYGAYDKRTFSTAILGDTMAEYCKDCLRCVQGCPKRLIHKTMNPEWEILGDDVYTPEIISANWTQATTGKIPVSGAGYGGVFAGSGFDSMWTDMSEIVRPTRDGIHGREYISTVVDVGKRPARLNFDGDDKIVTHPSRNVRLPIPIIFDTPPFGDLSPAVFESMALAAEMIGTKIIVPFEHVEGLLDHSRNVVPLLEDQELDPAWIGKFDMVEIADSEDVVAKVEKLRASSPGLVIVVRVPALASNVDRVVELARAGMDAVHCAAHYRGYEPTETGGKHIKDILRDVHARLLEAGVRDEITIIGGGGMAMAEHVIKGILCGANLVTVDVPLLIALECRVCTNCAEGGECPADISGIDPEWGSQRIVNLMGAWHNQLLEMMGAMGIREARRLRGEQGRVMFLEDLEAETFGKLFGERRV